MPITTKQRESRKNYLCSTDIVKIMMGQGYEVWAEKTDKLQPQKTTDAMEMGNAFERGIIAAAIKAGLLGPVIHNQFRVLDGTKIAAHLDAIEKATAKPVEAKLRRFDEGWGEPNSDQVPDDVIIQAQVHLMCTKEDFEKIFAVIAARGFRVQPFFVPTDKDLVEIILQIADNFWRHNIEADTPPDDSMPSLDVIKRIRRQPNSIIEIGKELIDEREKNQAVLRKATEDFEIADLALKTALGTAEAGRFNGGLVTYYQYHKKAETKLREAYDYRCLHIKKDK